MTGRRRVVLAWIGGLLLVAALPSSAAARSSTLTVSQVYPTGGAAGATYSTDYVELHNKTTSPINLSGMAVQYGSPAGTAWTSIPLTGNVPARGYFLLSLNTAGSGAALTPDQSSTIVNMGAGGGKVALTSSVAALSGACPSSASIVDLLGYGASGGTPVNCSETSPTPAPNSTSSAYLRGDNGCTDTDTNANDFAYATANPRNVTSTPVSCTNALPVLDTIGNKTFNENQTIAFDVTATDANPADTLTMTVSPSSVADATTSFTQTSSGAGTVTYRYSLQPTGSQYPGNSYNLRFQVSDGTDTDIEDMTLTVTNVNRAPDVFSGEATVKVGSLLQLPVPGSDPDTANSVTLSASNLPSGASFSPGAAANPASGQLSWTPSLAALGDHVVTFTATDNDADQLATSKQTTIHVVPNDPPVLAAVGDRAVDEGHTLQFDLSATDPEGDPVTYSASGLPAGATFSNATGSFGWTPGSDQAGSYTLTFGVSDGATSDTETVQITVNDVPSGGGGNGGGGGAVKAPTTTTVSAKAKGGKVNVAGTVLPAQAGGPIEITLLRSKKKGKPMKAIRSTTENLGVDGSFAAALKRKPEGRCQVTAEWAGDADSLPSSGVTRKFKC